MLNTTMPLLNLRFNRPSVHLALSVATWLSACAAQAQVPPGPDSSAATPAATPSASARGADPTALKPFAEVIKGAKVQAGFVPVWRKDERTWLEIPAALLGQPFLFSANTAQSIGERSLYASQMGPSGLAAFRRVGRSVQLVWLNTQFRGGPDAATRQAVAQGFSESLIGAAPLAAAPHTDNESLLVDASFLLSDVGMVSTALERAFRITYALDKPNSYLGAVHTDAGLTSLNARLHFSTARLAAPPLTPPATPLPEPPKTLPDPRSLFITQVYNFLALPDTPMAPRLADPRIGHFTASFTDLGSDLKPNPKVHYVKRWRLEKQDPGAALSEPVQPIVFWLDRAIPLRYRDAVARGVLQWNAAFEGIGFKNALVVRQQPDDAEFDTLDARHASIRWFVGADVGFARGPSHADPRTGEILDADIAMSDVFARGARRLMSEEHLSSDARLARVMAAVRDGQDCTYALEAAQEMAFAQDLLEARGDLAPDSPEAEAFVQAVIQSTITHEVGHTLGLKHNFKASTTIARAQLRDAAYTARHGISGSVMDYNPHNLPLRGEPVASYTQGQLGAYDHWAIAYAYQPLAPADEAAGLARTAARSTEPELAFADDADAEGGPTGGIDPLVNRFDLGDDPLAYFQRRLALSRELWTRVQARRPQAGDDPLRARRSLLSGFRQLRSLPELTAKYIGGMVTRREPPGPGRPAGYEPVEPARQREALRFLTEALFQPDSFQFRAEYLAAAGPDYVEWERDKPVSVPTLVAQLQTQALERLLSAGTAQRVLELPAYLPQTAQRDALTLNEVYARVHGAIWQELKAGGDIHPLRRTLQREHLKRLQTLLTKPAALPADALSLLRWQARQLLTELHQAGKRPHLGIDTRAHLQDSLDLLTQALQATMQRS